ncbi:hypothetical protein CR513_16876, partial [Mucuna pruriens]
MSQVKVDLIQHLWKMTNKVGIFGNSVCQRGANTYMDSLTLSPFRPYVIKQARFKSTCNRGSLTERKGAT